MEWWTHLWLNEGFATFMGYLCTDYIYPDWKIWERFIASGILGAMELDSLDSSHPVEVPVGHPSETDEIFDAISYNKGCAIIRMVHSWISDQHFRSGMKNYLEKYSYSNAQTESLWQELGAVSGLPVESVMAGWTKQIGFPLIQVRIQSWSGNSCKLSLRQSKFSAKSTSEGDQSFSWSVPISISTSAETTQSFLLESGEMEVTLDLPESGWVKINPQFINWQLVNYDKQLLDKLTQNMQQLSTLDRLTLVFEVYTLAKTGIISICDFLQLLNGFKQETNLSVWTSIADSLRDIGRITEELSLADSYHKYQVFVEKLMQQAAGTVGISKQLNEDPNRTLLRSLFYSMMSKAGSESYLNHSVEQVHLYLENSNQSLDKDLKSIMISNYLTKQSSAPGQALDKIFKMHAEAEMTEEKNAIERSFGGISITEIDKVIEYILSPAVRNQDKSDAFLSLAAAGKLKREAVLNLTFSKIEKFKKLFDGVQIGRYLKILLNLFSTRSEYNKIRDFFELNAIPNADRSIRQGTGIQLFSNQ